MDEIKFFQLLSEKFDSEVLDHIYSYDNLIYSMYDFYKKYGYLDYNEQIERDKIQHYLLLFGLDEILVLSNITENNEIIFRTVDKKFIVSFEPDDKEEKLIKDLLLFLYEYSAELLNVNLNMKRLNKFIDRHIESIVNCQFLYKDIIKPFKKCEYIDYKLLKESRGIANYIKNVVKRDIENFV